MHHVVFCRKPRVWPIKKMNRTQQMLYYEDHKATLFGVRRLSRRLARNSAFGPVIGVWPGDQRSAIGVWPGDRRLTW